MALKQRLFSITEPQERWLLARSAQLGVSHAELMRRILDVARGEIGELLTVSSRAPSMLATADSVVSPVNKAPTDRAQAIRELMLYCQEQGIPETRITQVLTEWMNGADWRQASAADYRSVLAILRNGPQPEYSDIAEPGA